MEVKEKLEIKTEMLKAARENKGYKQDELAKMIFTTRQSISNWENGKKTPTLENLKRLCEVLNISIDDLLVRKVEKELETNEEELAFNNDIDYSVVDDLAIIKSTRKDLKIIKIILIVIAILLAMYLISSIRKFIILNEIRSKMIQYENVDNYSFEKNYYSINNNQNIISYTENILYKEGSSKKIIYDYNTENIEILYENDNNVINIYEEDKEYKVEEKNEFTCIDNNIFKQIEGTLIKRKNIDNFFNAFNPYLKIKYEENCYLLEKNTNKANCPYIIEKINYDNLLNEINFFYSNGYYEKFTYEVELNDVTEQDVSINLEEYKLKK